ncbi:MdtA/MuxA family multidrug efflux RND transporter periplasmic adaptor subunit [Entomomonas asaccharolytica]|uniref:MdtA/MuxA family multidrug efflux RND transporter periplasmic adaptor subunit n=1 Tax=Entomomonas asaccharolytica TaxID=2785331 RepID=A0A974NI16_9GAMM|nr:MdtA/MuxA family multidrug efflux RND transporter periplasmic adaptor subunit [Entomomonas asaccharolytica]QQP86980.1 MdtA/MuxA family multidrug efflux RND transporter periplasmic adaptor subunit [Entomomonas asaccharolytica]
MNDKQENMQSNQANSNKKWIIISLIIILVIVGVSWWGKSTSPTSTSENDSSPFGRRGMGMFSNVVPVRVEAVKEDEFAVYLNALGTVTAYNTVNIVSRVQGELVKVLFTEGQQVKENDLLAVIDPRPYEAALQQAKGAVQQNQALLQNARSELTRYQKLIKQDSIAKQTYESQMALVNQYQGSVLTSQAQLKEAELNLEFTQIKAPITGRLGLRQIDIGNYIKVGDTTPLVSITQTQPISTTFTLPEAQLPEVASRLAKGEDLVVEAWDSTNTHLLATGLVETLDNQINTSTGTILVKARFTNEDSMLFPNQFVNIKLKLTTLDKQLIIPTDSVQYGNKGTFVYVVEGNKVHLRYITIGRSDADKTIVVEGLKVGERVVLEGTDRLREDSQVEVVNSEDILTTIENIEEKPQPSENAEVSE